MIRLLCIIVCALAVFMKVNAEDLEPQIKVTDVQLWHANQKYVSALKYHITKHNETYNNIGLHWIIAQDLPADVVTTSKVYVTDSKHENAKLLLEDNTPICKVSPNRELLPKVVVFDESQLQGKCVKAGVHDTEDMGNFRFEVLVPNIHEISDHHYVYYRVGNEDEVVLEVTFYSEDDFYEKSTK